MVIFFSPFFDILYHVEHSASDLLPYLICNAGIPRMTKLYWSLRTKRFSMAQDLFLYRVSYKMQRIPHFFHQAGVFCAEWNNERRGRMKLHVGVNIGDNGWFGTVGLAAKNADPSNPSSSPVTITIRIERFVDTPLLLYGRPISKSDATPEALSCAPL